ncbi:MAG: twin-arginine translocase TatA/TatE family subunit [Hydrogenobacter thermophilus]|uniref:twin-arginine translocase TatA/TatE family subunit n=1 Tax=Hydrogenobacter thermophilus TaxID=940 RepID=UPI001C745967|nr:twin-arginine translocase TatA/TatE family subunit [Hydrogenobacter thermophilus]QWK20063.1 MAG: twin-arginine translocase TatA/TatE family subunit [Hydrogenobacter thermophilus]
MDFPEIALILLVAFIFLGPEKMMELATKMGELLRKIRETWDELRYQMYVENINKKVLEEQEEIQSTEEATHEVKEDGTTGTTQDASDGTSERTEKQTD